VHDTVSRFPPVAEEKKMPASPEKVARAQGKNSANLDAHSPSEMSGLLGSYRSTNSAFHKGDDLSNELGKALVLESCG
jgi:hypothetical protein